MLEEIKKEFEKFPIKKILYDTDEGQTFIAELIAVDKRNLWQFIEQTLTGVIENYETVLAEVSKVYCELTNGKLSKPNYQAAVIIDEVRMIQENELTEAITQAKIEENEYWKRKIFHPNSIMPGISIMDFAIRINELKETHN